MAMWSLEEVGVGLLVVVATVVPDTGGICVFAKMCLCHNLCERRCECQVLPVVLCPHSVGSGLCLCMLSRSTAELFPYAGIVRAMSTSITWEVPLPNNSV
jgi:hypothetical protein